MTLLKSWHKLDKQDLSFRVFQPNPNQIQQSDEAVIFSTILYTNNNLPQGYLVSNIIQLVQYLLLSQCVGSGLQMLTFYMNMSTQNGS